MDSYIFCRSHQPKKMMKNLQLNYMAKTFDYSDMNLMPRLCIVESRSQCDTSVKLGNWTFKVPVVPANMECVINQDIALNLASNGYFYIMHRFGISDDDVIEFIKMMKSRDLPSSISIGVKEDSFSLIAKLKDNDAIPDFITIDIAHGHAESVKNLIGYIQHNFDNVFIIAGNVCTPDAAVDLENWGANAIKVGIGPGSACTTYNVTGFGSRGMQAYCVLRCSEAVKDSIIIADGGIQHPGEIAKALALGASIVMIGGMFSGLSDSPGDVVVVDGTRYKEFWGSASAYNSGKKNRVEGTKKLVKLDNTTNLEKMKYIEECLQSAISYAGGDDLSSLKSVKWLI